MEKVPAILSVIHDRLNPLIYCYQHYKAVISKQVQVFGVRLFLPVIVTSYRDQCATESLPFKLAGLPFHTGKHELLFRILTRREKRNARQGFYFSTPHPERHKG
jgi:hypothetical protein